MRHQIHNNSRLIYFAKPPAEAQKSSERLLSPEQERFCKELEELEGSQHAKAIAKQFRKGKIEEKTFKEAREVLKDPNKMKDDAYKHFMKALGKGKFPNKAKNAHTFLQALEGSAEEKKYAKDLVRDLSQDDTGPLSARVEKIHLKKLTAFRQEAVAKETLKTTGAAAGTIAASADVHSSLEQAAEVEETNWEKERLSPELVERINALEKKRMKVQQKYVQKADEHKQAVAEGRDDAEIKALEEQLRKLDAEVEKIQEELSEPKSKEIAYYTRMGRRKEIIDDFIAESGIDIEKTKTLKIWVPEEDSSGAMVIDKKTGKANRKEETITIEKIFFDKDRSDLTDEAPGALMIKFAHEPKPKTAENALGFFNAYNAYKEIESVADLNEEVMEFTGNQKLRVGMEFETTETSLDDNNKPIAHHKKFKIESIDKEKGTITLDKAILATPRQWISNTVHRKLYFDRIQREFTFGEFAKLIKQHKYGVELTADQATAQLEETDSPTLQPKESRKIIYADETERRREGTLSRDEDSYYIEQAPIRTRSQYPSIETMTTAGVPLSLAAAYQARLPDRDENGEVWKRRKVSGRNLLQMANKGAVAAAPTEADDDSGGFGTGDDDFMAEKPKPAQAEEAPKSKEGKKLTIHDEALKYDDIHKTGGMQKRQRNFLLKMWDETRFLDATDIWAMGKAMWEYYIRRYERRQKERYSSIGKDLPFFAPEMQRINQAAENEEVNQFKETFEQKGVYEIQGRLRKTRNRDEMKAAFIVLSEKGQLRWDDIEMWQNLNRFVDARVAIPIPANGDPATWISETDKRTGADFLKGAIDSLWGEGNYNGWFNRNKSSYQSDAKSYYEEGKELEGVEGGHARRLATLLQQHKRGEFVDPHEYEGLIIHSIDAGKSSMQAKLYYMIEGVAAINGEGRTIMPFDRLAHINSEMLTKFPILEYICAKIKRPDGGLHRFTIDDYKRWVNIFDEGDTMNPLRCEPGVAVDKFMWTYVIPSDETQNRINKVMRAGEALDHDDMFAYLPPATEQIITDACRATTGSKKFYTVEGYANAFPGFSQYFRSLAENDNRNKLKEAIKSFVRYDGIITNRFEKEDKGYQRFDTATLNSGTIVTPDRPPQVYIDQLHAVIEAILNAYGDQKLIDTYRLLRETTGDIHSDKDEMAKQTRINQAFRDFGEIFNNVIKRDNGEKMVRIIASAGLEGMPFGLSDQERDRRKAAYADSSELQ